MGKLIELYSPKPFSITNKTETTAEILLYGEIGENWDGTGITALKFTEELKKIPASVKNIDIRINSFGGSVFEGMVIYTRLKEHKAKKTVYVDGLAASIASVIAMSGDEIVMGDGSFIMIHKPISGVRGNAHEMERMIGILDKIEEQMITIYSKKTKMSRAELSSMLDAETWIPCEECMKLGMADRQIEAKETLYLVASAFEKGSKFFKNAPKIKTTSDIAKEKLSNLLQTIEGKK